MSWDTPIDRTHASILGTIDHGFYFALDIRAHPLAMSMVVYTALN
jgi:hypothetical protein